MSLANTPETLNVEAQKREVDREVPEVPLCDLWRNEPPLNRDLHLRQIILLIQSLEHLWHDRSGSQITRKLEKFTLDQVLVLFGQDSVSIRQLIASVSRSLLQPAISLHPLR